MAFVIPFHFFREFVQSVAPSEFAEIQKRELSDSLAIEADSRLSDRIANSKIGDWKGLQAVIMKQIDEWSSKSDPNLVFDGVILRSSGNCEDLPGCSSAGLYHSELVEGFKWPDIERGILRVWASVFNKRALADRREFEIPEAAVGMAVLVMPLLNSCVAANGVAVTANPLRRDLGGVYINAQVGTVAVTDACQGEQPEQVLIYQDRLPGLSLQYLAASSLLEPGEFIIDEDLGARLNTVMLRNLHERFRADSNAIDSEFFILKNREIVIVQVRPVNM
jgi:hypothetical protein